MRLERFKIQKFSYPGKREAHYLDPITCSHGPSGLGTFFPPKTRPFSPPPGKKLVAPLIPVLEVLSDLEKNGKNICF